MIPVVDLCTPPPLSTFPPSLSFPLFLSPFPFFLLFFFFPFFFLSRSRSAALMTNMPVFISTCPQSVGNPASGSHTGGRKQVEQWKVDGGPAAPWHLLPPLCSFRACLGLLGQPPGLQARAPSRCQAGGWAADVTSSGAPWVLPSGHRCPVSHVLKNRRSPPLGTDQLAGAAKGAVLFFPLGWSE